MIYDSAVRQAIKERLTIVECSYKIIEYTELLKELAQQEKTDKEEIKEIAENIEHYAICIEILRGTI